MAIAVETNTSTTMWTVYGIELLTSATRRIMIRVLIGPTTRVPLGQSSFQHSKVRWYSRGVRRKQTALGFVLLLSEANYRVTNEALITSKSKQRIDQHCFSSFQIEWWSKLTHIKQNNYLTFIPTCNDDATSVRGETFLSTEKAIPLYSKDNAHLVNDRYLPKTYMDGLKPL